MTLIFELSKLEAVVSNKLLGKELLAVSGQVDTFAITFDGSLFPVPGLSMVEDTSSIKPHEPLVLPELAIIPWSVIIVTSIAAVDHLDNAMRKSPLPMFTTAVLVFKLISIFLRALDTDLLLLQVLRESGKLTLFSGMTFVGKHANHIVSFWYAR